MGMCKVNGPDALPVNPAGLENLGKATNNICEAGALYAFAHYTDFGQRLPPRPNLSEFGDPNETRFGQDTQVHPDILHYVRHCERLDSRSRTWLQEQARRESVKTRRKLKKQSKRICRQLGIAYK